MEQPRAAHRKAFWCLNSMLTPVVISYLLEPIIFSEYFPQIIRESFLGVVILTTLTLLRLFFYSGIYGTMLEVVSGQEVTLSFRRFSQNVKEYWKIYLCLSVFPVMIHFLLFAFFSYLDITFFAVTTFSDQIILAFLAHFIISKKYIRPFNLPRRKLVLGWAVFCIMASMNITIVFFLRLTALDKVEFFYLHRILFFLFKYMHFFIFIYFSSLVLRLYPEIKQRFSGNKELFLISPPGGGLVYALSSLVARFYPPVFTVLRALTPSEYRIKEFHQVMWQEHYYEPNKLVAITCFSSNSAEAYKIAKEFKRRGSKVVMGGPHVMFMPEEALEYCDSVVIGDAEPVWEDVLKDYEAGTLKEKYFGPLVKEYYEKVHEGMKTLPPEISAKYIETGRGCKFNCDFCVIPALCGQKIRKKPIPEVIEVVKKASQKKKSFLFLDNNIYADAVYAKELFRALIPLKVKWAASCSLDLAKDEETLALAKKSGCHTLLIGYEISDYSLEKAQGGKFAMTERYRELTKKIKKKGISIKGHFIYGFDSDNLKSLFDLWRFCFSIFPVFTVVSFLTPFPGTKFFQRMMRENRLLNLNWRSYATNRFVFQPKGISIPFFNFFYLFFLAFFLVTTSVVGVVLFLCWILVNI